MTYKEFQEKTEANLTEFITRNDIHPYHQGIDSYSLREKSQELLKIW